MFSLSRLVLSEVSGIWDLATKDIGFVASIRLATSFPSALARKFMEWERTVVAEE